MQAGVDRTGNVFCEFLCSLYMRYEYSAVVMLRSQRQEADNALCDKNKNETGKRGTGNKEKSGKCEADGNKLCIERRPG